MRGEILSRLTPKLATFVWGLILFRAARCKHSTPCRCSARNMFYDERWIAKQERSFTKWVNYTFATHSADGFDPLDDLGA